MRKRSKSELKKAANEIIDMFNRGIFLPPLMFTNQQRAAIANIAGVDAEGTFADGPMEEALIREYKLDIRYGENTWPAFAEVLRQEKNDRLCILSGERKDHLRWLQNAVGSCLAVGIDREEIVEVAESAW